MPKKSSKKSKSARKPYSYRRSFKRSRGFDRGNYAPYGRQATGRAAMYNPVPARLHNIVAPRFWTDLEYGYSGYIQVAAAAVNFTVSGNGIRLPGNTANLFTGAGVGGTLVPATHALNALSTTGFTALAGLYSAFRVWGSKITVTAQPANESTASPKLVVIIPTVTEAALADTQLAQSLPYSKALVVAPNADVKHNTIITQMDTKSIYGLS